VFGVNSKLAQLTLKANLPPTQKNGWRRVKAGAKHITPNLASAVSNKNNFKFERSGKIMFN